MYQHLSDNPHLIVNGFVSSGITNTISDALVAVAEEEYELTSCDEDDSDDGAAAFSDEDQ